MPYYTDLHLHSNNSEGALSCRELITKAKKNGIRALALTDHDGVDGVEEMVSLGKKNKIKVITGVEIYTKYKNKDLHLLGYGFDLTDSKLNSALKKLQQKHLINIDNSLKKLKDYGFKIDFALFDKLKNKYIGLAQIVGILKKYPKNRKIIQKDCRTQSPNTFTIINHYFAKSGITPLPEESLPIEQAMNLIKKARGLTVLAHPGQTLRWKDDKLIIELKNKGLDGLEVLSPHHNLDQIEHYQSLAKKYKLIITGGSDFHGNSPGENLIKNQWDYFKAPYPIYKNLKKRLNNSRAI